MRRPSDICRRLKQREETQFTPLVVMDPAADPESRVRFLSSGADDIMMPPVDAREILARVGRLLKQKGELDSLRARYHTALNASANDTLTGLFNQGYFKRFLKLELKRSVRQNHPTSLVLLDIDNFKSLNDTLGHLAGDKILSELAGRIRSSIREIDLAARYGGEEFVVVLPYTGQGRSRGGGGADPRRGGLPGVPSGDELSPCPGDRQRRRGHWT